MNKDTMLKTKSQKSFQISYLKEYFKNDYVTFLAAYNTNVKIIFF